MEKINEAIYLKRKNLGNYEHEEVSLSATPDEGQSGIEILKELKEIVDSFLNSKDAGGTDLSQKPKSVEKENKNGSKKESSKKVVKEESSEEEISEEVDEEDSDSSDEDTEEELPKKKKATKKTKAKVTVYERSNTLHQKILGEYLDDNLPGWTKKYAKQSRTTSNKMEGKDFLDQDGEILESFGSDFIKKLKAYV
jgi:hypothetical protein